MVFNTGKFKLLQIGKNDDLKKMYNYENCEKNGPFLPSENAKDLGILISNNGNFNDHIEKTIKKVNQKVGWILRSFQSRDSELLRFCWKTYILPKLDYCSQLWGPCEGSMLYKLENVQRAYTAKVNGLQNINYWDRLAELKLFSIERRI